MNNSSSLSNGLTPDQLKQIDLYKFSYVPNGKLPERIRRKIAYKHALKVELFIEQAGRCCICERPMRLVYGGDTGDCATFEHVILASQGGGFKKENVPLSCGRCNRERGTREFHEFKSYVLENGLSKDKRRPQRKPNKNERLLELGQEHVLETFLCKRLNTALYIFAVENGWRDDKSIAEIEKLKTRLEVPVDLLKVFEDGKMG